MTAEGSIAIVEPLDRASSHGGRRHANREADPGPDLGAAARDAVVFYLHDAALHPAPQAADQPTDPVEGQTAQRLLAEAEAVDTAAADSSAWRAAALSIAALDRIEAAAAKVEADIAAAIHTQTELRAGAGAAAETAVEAALAAWEAAGAAVEAEGRAEVILRRIEHYLTITVGLLLFAIIVLVVTSTATR